MRPWMTLCLLAVSLPSPAAVIETKTGGFQVVLDTTVAETPQGAFDAFTGDVSGWWDHHFSDKPKALYIEPKPGGGFYEIFDDAGNGAKHGEVIYVKYGEEIRFTGPLGFSGNALSLVHTVTFTAADEGSTKVQVVVDAAGHLEPGWAAAVDGVWHHFLVEQYKPWVDEGHHRDRQ